MADLAIKGTSHLVQLDDADLPLVAQHAWRAMKDGDHIYAVCSGGRAEGKAVVILMHRLILNANPGVFVDHVNGNGLDNRRENIRLCSNAQNMMNMRKLPGKSSRFKGVSWDQREKRWRATIKKSGRSIRLGEFDCEVRAAKQYDRAARLMFREFAKTNEMLNLLT